MNTVKIFLLRWLGNFLLLSALAGVFLTFWPVAKAEFFYRKDQVQGKKYVVSEDKPGVNLLGLEQPLVITPLSTTFGIVIPKIAANARVIDDIDPADSKVYLRALKEGVAHASGTAYPGAEGNVYLFAHSVGNFWEVNQWNAVFYLLRELNPGDEVNIFYREKRYVYVVYDKKIVDPTDVAYLDTIANFPTLTLQTCWPPGTTLKRLLVFARLKS